MEEEGPRLCLRGSVTDVDLCSVGGNMASPPKLRLTVDVPFPTPAVGSTVATARFSAPAQSQQAVDTSYDRGGYGSSGGAIEHMATPSDGAAAPRLPLILPTHCKHQSARAYEVVWP